MIQKFTIYKNSRKKNIDLRIFLVFASTIWWLFLGALSLFDFSRLQVAWTENVFFAIYIYFPICFLLCIFVIKIFPMRSPGRLSSAEINLVHIFDKLFFIFIFLFGIQAVIFSLPALSEDPSGERLNWGLKYLHVATEIVIRAGVLITIGCAVGGGYFSGKHFIIIFFGILYAALVVSRGLILEFLIYFIFGLILKNYYKNNKFVINIRYIFLILIVWLIFYIYGEWRQGDDFSISDYGMMIIDSSFVAWFFGYFIVNYENLALIIMNNYSNDSITNIFGPFLQVLQISRYEQIDDYIYVGRFNLGTALRPFVLDFGPWFGGVAFTFLYSVLLLLPNLCKFMSTRTAIFIALCYFAFLFPVTGRLEQPAYIIPLAMILVADRIFYWLHKKSDPR